MHVKSEDWEPDWDAEREREHDERAYAHALDAVGRQPPLVRERAADLLAPTWDEDVDVELDEDGEPIVVATRERFVGVSPRRALRLAWVDLRAFARFVSPRRERTRRRARRPAVAGQRRRRSSRASPDRPRLLDPAALDGARRFSELFAELMLRRDAGLPPDSPAPVSGRLEAAALRRAAASDGHSNREHGRPETSDHIIESGDSWRGTSVRLRRTT